MFEPTVAEPFSQNVLRKDEDAMAGAIGVAGDVFNRHEPVTGAVGMALQCGVQERICSCTRSRPAPIRYAATLRPLDTLARGTALVNGVAWVSAGLSRSTGAGRA